MKRSLYCNIVGYDFTFVETDGKLSELNFGCKQIVDAKKDKSSLLLKAATELEEYFAGNRQIFDIPLAPEGTEFQKKVWQALLQIPYGETRSYKEIAIASGSPKGCRAAGMANNRNPIAIIIPCHRVIGADGKLVGYAGGLDLKSKLLNHEKNANTFD